MESENGNDTFLNSLDDQKIPQRLKFAEVLWELFLQLCKFWRRPDSREGEYNLFLQFFWVGGGV